MCSLQACMPHAVHFQVLPAMLASAVLLLFMSSAVGSTGPFVGEIFKYGDNPDHRSNDSGTHWTYDLAGDDWNGKDAAGNPWVCLTSKQQSPVNLPAAPSDAAAIEPTHQTVWQLGAVTANGSNVAVANNGHSVQVFWNEPSFAPSVSIVIQEGQPLHSTLDLQNGNKVTTVKAVAEHFHFHAHSEHLVGGRIFPLEAHLVSVVEQSELPSCPTSGCIVVTAVMFELGQDSTEDNPWLAPLFDKMPYEEEEVAYLPAGAQLDLQQLLPSNTSYMAYSGSLTTPPCTEGVLWMVLMNTQTISLNQWRNFMKAIGDYNCTSEADGNSNATEPTPRIGLADNPIPDNSTNTTDQSADSSNRSVPPELLGVGSVRVPSTGLKRHLATAAGSIQRQVCSKLGAGSNYRMPQLLNNRTLRVWKNLPVKKSYLPADAATAASAGAIAGIVLGVTLGAGTTAGFGYLGWKMYNKRRVDRMYKLGVNDNDMMMVQQEVERQWLAATPSSAAASAGLARRSHGEIPL